MSHRKIAIVTHTGSDMSLEEAQQLGIYMIADCVIFGEDEYKNMTEISASQFYEMLKTAEKLPTSSQPAVGDFVKTFRQAAAEHPDAEAILCLMITSKMSGCYRAACTAAQLVKRQGFSIPVLVYDTLQCSHGMAQMVREAASLADEGLGAEEIAACMDTIQHKMGVYLMLDSLQNAYKGGRVGAITAKTVQMLGIKPLLVFSDGLVREWSIARNDESGSNKMAEQLYKEGNLDKPVTVFHAGVPERAEELRKKILMRMPEARVNIASVGPVIGIYTGIGCIGLAFTKKEGA